MKKMKFGRRIVVAVGTLALAMSGVAGAAHADDTGAGNIVTDQATTLTIHKHSGAQGDAGDGTKQALDTTKNPALAGVTFKIQQVTKKGTADIDLDTQAGWDLIKGVKASDVVGSGYTLDAGTSAVTDSNGEITKTLPHGLYLITETDAPDNVVSKAAPFLVTLPLPQGNGSWLYDVHVYPKNQLQDVPTKTVAEPTASVLGSDVTWTITAKVPSLNKEDSLSSFIVTDTLDSRLAYKSVKIGDLVEGTDYTVAQSGQTVTITFTDPKALKVGDVKIDLTTTVKSLGDGVIENTATQYVNNPGQDHGTNTNTPKSNWGDLQITKVATGDDAKKLAGAVFGVYSDSTASTKVGEITTGADGTGHLTLWVGNDDVTSKGYWIKEIKAPAGYVLSDDITPVTVKAGETASTKVTVENVQQDHPNLPLTGANGQMLAIIGGSALVLLAAGSALMINRRRKAQH